MSATIAPLDGTEDVQQVGERIAELAAHIHAATYRLLVLLREFDDRDGWQGWKTCAQWLSWRTGIGLEAAREKVRVARALPELPRIAAAFERGELSYSKVRAITRIAEPATEEMLLDTARHGTASQVERVVRGVRRADPAEENRRAKRRADALVLLADSALASGFPGRKAADAHQVVVHVDAEVLADAAADGRSELEDGSRVSAETSRRIACDAGLLAVLEEADGTPLSVGRRRRTVPPSLRRALVSRDGGCRFPGCDHTRWLEAHHIEHWANGGETKLDNLVHLCSFHHRLLHEGGLRVAREADRRLAFSTPGGVAIEAVPPAPCTGSVSQLERENRTLGIDSSTIPVWAGDPIDYGFAVSALVKRLSSPRP